MSMTMTLRRIPAGDLEALEADPERPATLLFDEDAEDLSEVVDIDKMWHGLHWLLTGSDWDTAGPGEVLLGGEEIGEDISYGPARLHRPEAVARLSTLLGGLSEDELRENWDPQEMMDADLYPRIWDEGDSVYENELLPAFRQVRALFATAAERGEAVLVGLV